MSAPPPAPRPTRHRWVAAATGLCLVLACAGVLPGTGPRGGLLAAAAGCAGLAGLYALVVLLSRERIQVSWLPGLLDVVGATAVSTSTTTLVLLTSVQEATGLGAPAVLLLLPATLGMVVVCVAVTTAALTRAPRDPRQSALSVAATAALGAEALSLGHLLGLWGLLAPQTALRVVAVAALLLGVVVLRGPPPRALLREDAHVLVLGPAAITAAACAALLVAHATRAPAVTVVAAVVAVLVSTTKSLVVYGRTTSLNVSREQALTDDLTGLGNRRALTARLDAASRSAPVALALVDLDRFKAVNDVLGHDAGDELLRQVGARLRSLARTEDLVARQGGDEFAIVMGGAAVLVGLVAVVVVLVRASGVRERRDLVVWRPVAAGAALLWAGDLPGSLGGGPGPLGHPAAAAATTAGIFLVMVGQLALMRQHVLTHHLRGWLDLVGGLLVGFALLAGIGLGAFLRASGASGPEALAALARTSTGELAATFTVLSVALARSAGERRSALVLAAMVTLFPVEVARLVLVWGGPPPGGAATLVPLVGHAVVLVLLAAAGRHPCTAPAERPREGTAAVVLGPLVFLVLAAGLLGLDHVVDVPTVAVVCALGVVVLQVVSVLVVYAGLDDLLASRDQSLTDDLTGLGNRRALLAHLGRIEHRAGPGRGPAGPVALALLDLDRFKAVNDTLGHDAGDELLRQVGQRLRAASREDDLLTRQGGDEFAVVLTGATAQEAARRLLEVVLAVEAPFTVGAVEVGVDASVGVAAWPEHAADPESLLRAADAAMYRAKGLGGGVVVHDAGVDRARREVESLVADLRAAVAEDALTAVFQPQVGADGALVGVEALVRWDHRSRGRLEPEVFLPLAERHGLMPALTGQVLLKALAVAADLRGAGGGGGAQGEEPVRVSVNASATSLRDDSLVAAVTAALARSGAPAGSLVVEITETQLVDDPATALLVVRALVALGVEISIDDYGTGYSSLAHLVDLSASELKLDRSLVAGAATDARLAAIVSSTVTLAHDLGMRLVAEGVEDAQTLDLVLGLGVDVTQGFWHAGPLEASDLLAWAQRRPAAAGTVG